MSWIKYITEWFKEVSKDKTLPFIPKDEAQPSSLSEEEQDKIDKMANIFASGCIIVIFCFITIGLGMWLGNENDEFDYENHWTVVENSAENAVITKIQIGQEYDGRFVLYTPYITVETENGETGSFALKAEKYLSSVPFSIGDACTVSIKEYTGEMFTFRGMDINNGDTAWFINDELVFYQTEDEMAQKYLKEAT